MYWLHHILCLIVSAQDGVSITPDNATFIENDTVILQCITYGGPGNTFEWIFNETVIEITSNLTLTGVMTEDGGSYTCNVTNAAGSDTYTTYVFIRPMITLNPTSVNVSVGDNVSFMCDAMGFPTPSILWMKEDGDLPVNATGENTTNLTIAQVEFGNEGFYYCVATSNDLVVESARTTLSG